MTLAFLVSLVEHDVLLPTDLPLKFIEVLVGLGRPDAALALHRAGSSGSQDKAAPHGSTGGAPGLGITAAAGGQGSQPSISQARILVELRLRCVDVVGTAGRARGGNVRPHHSLACADWG
jgi:hypothetical protein